ncbi:multidrug ABC transporter ATP-binding protein [Tersicoccus phoenicis]|uniref:Multidrug ABC transporter ATP-binding protein n=1 Tax=Tersicoccus phoenicis TaxID=554083 RepID=A0A1R1LJP5_9MICC|nr:ATP-binding cassette domain-containing protein [Tersicoccus phoenicis]OMH27758.1 multidrug ABC transporter ATP-binding protein [Tersicoccus phoenicis]
MVIATAGLTKRFRHQLAVDGVDLAVPRGSVFGFLGPNGSGKTTTIRMLLGLVAPSGGRVRVLGEAVPERLLSVLPRVGALVEGPAFYPFLSGTANLVRLDTADRRADPRTRCARVAGALDRVGLTQAAGKKVHAYSLGMKQRLGLAAALLAPRELLVLDEPTNGLDPQGTREVRGLIRSLADDGTTVFVSSHLLAEIDQICTHAAVLRAGRLVAQGTLDELRRSGTGRAVVHTPDGDRARAVLTALGLTVAPELSPGVVSADLPDDGPAPESLVAGLVAGGVRVRGFAVERAGLEERFVQLTGEGFDVDQ